MTARDLRILVVGGGIGGLAVARTLRRAGFAPHVVERRPASNVAGAGIYLPGNGARALRALGLHEPLRQVGAVIARQRIFTSGGRLLVDVDVDELWAGVGECWALPRADLHRILLAGAGEDVRHGIEVRGLEIMDGAADVAFDDGTSAAYDLVVAADGARSTVRRLAGLGGDAKPVGQLAYRTVIAGGPPVDAWTVLLGRGTSFLVMPIGGGRLYCYADEPLRPDVPPPADPVARLRRLFAGFGGPVPEILTRLDQIQVGPIEEVELPRWSRGPVVLIGDAAHASSPNMAQGAVMALEDALVLAEELARATAVPQAITGYEARRRPRTTWVLDRTHERDRARGLPGLLRHAVLRGRGRAMYHRHYRPLLDPP